MVGIFYCFDLGQGAYRVRLVTIYGIIVVQSHASYIRR